MGTCHHGSLKQNDLSLSLSLNKAFVRAQLWYKFSPTWCEFRDQEKIENFPEVILKNFCYVTEV